MNPLATAEFLISINQNEKAKIALDLIKPYAITIEQLDAIGKLYADIRDFESCLELALILHSKANTKEMQWDTRVNIIRAYLNLNNPEDAIVYIDINDRINPNDHPNRMDKAMSLFLLNRKTEGEAILRKILTEPMVDDIEHRVQFNLGTYELSNGDFKSGLRKVLLDGRKLNIWQKFKLPESQLWEGVPQKGKKILLCAEGGIGDEIISIRFAKHFKDVGMIPVWYTDRKDLAAIFKRNGFDVVTDLSIFDDTWLWAYSMPSPSYLELEETDLWYGKYLTAKNSSPILAGKKKIGIKCSGNPKYDQDLNRSIPFDQLVDAIPNEYEIYSFHIDEDHTHPRVTSLKDSIKSWDDTLDYLDQMDIVVSSCTSLAHAAAAMDKPLYVFVPILNYYTWARPTTNSSWYSDNVHILRQVKPSDWSGTFIELESLL